MENSNNNLILSFENERLKVRGKARICLIIALVFVIAAVICFVIADDNDPLIIGVIIGAVGAVACIGIRSLLVSKFSRNCLKQMKKVVFDKYFPGWKCNEKVGMRKDEILFPGFFTSPDRFHSSELTSSSYNGIAFRSSKYKLERRETTHTKNGTQTTYVPYAVGTMYFFDFEREFGQTVKILEKGGSLANNRGLKKVETEYIQFNKKFSIYTSDETQVFYLLTPQIQEKIMGLEKLFKGTFLLGFIGSDLWLAVNDSNETLKMSIKKPINEETFHKLEMLLATPKLIIDNLGLDKAKFKKDAGTTI